MHGSDPEEWKHSRHMWPNATAVAPDSSPSQFICKDGRKIYVGDCALFKLPRHSPPFIGIIRKLIFNKEESPTLEVNWLYRHADVKLSKGVLEAAPNEVFYSYHKDEISAASLLHPCKVAFLRKGVELPPGISAFVCRRVYDIENNCLWWLTDKDYINAVPEEIDRLLDKTKLEMHGAAQSGGRSPKPLNGPTSTQSLKSGSDSVQNSSSFGTQVKGKKRERGDQGSDSSKRERLFKAEDGDFGTVRSESMLKTEISKITDKGGLVDFEGVERLVQLMQPDSADKKIDLGGRIILVNVIAATERDDCLGWFVQLRGLPVLDEWLQEVHKGKNGDSNTLKEGDKSVEEFLLALLRALDRLPVNLHALQTCNVGKSVNHLRTHKNSEIQRKARSLVDTWKKRVEAEMNMTDSKAGSTRPVSWQAKPAASEVSHVGSKKTGGSENAAKGSAIQPSLSKNSLARHGSGEAMSKSSAPSSIKLMTTSVGCTSKDQNVKAVASDQPLTPIKEERSSSSSQSQNNSLSCSSEHAKTIGSCREDSRSSTAVSMSASKIAGGTSRTRKSSNGLHGTSVALSQKEPTSGRSSARNSPSEKVSPTRVTQEKSSDLPLTDQGNNQRLILRLPNTARSPARSASGASFEEPAIPCGIASPPADKNESRDRRVKAKNDGLHTIVSSTVITDASATNEASTGGEDGKGSPVADEQGRVNEDGDQVPETSKQTNSSSGFIPRSGQTFDASLSPMNALVESCVKFSEASASVSPGDDGMNLLATVAAGEISRSENVSPLASPERKSSAADESSSGNVSKLKHPGEIAANSVAQSDGGASAEPHLNVVEPVQFKNDSRHPLTMTSRGSSGDEAVSSSCKEKTSDDRAQMNVSTTDLLQNTESPCVQPETVESASETVIPSKKESREEPGGENHFHVQRDFGSQWAKQSSSEFKKEMVDHLDEAIVKNDEMLVSKDTITSLKIEKELGEKLLKLSSDVGKDNKISAEVTGISVQKSSSVAESCESLDFKKVDVTPPSASGNSLMASRDEHANEMKVAANNPDEKLMDPEPTALPDVSGCGKDISVLKEVLGQCAGSSNPPELSKVPAKEKAVSKTSEGNLVGKESDVAGEHHAHSTQPSHTVAGSDAGVILDFDLNEGFAVDDANHGEIVRQEEHITSSAVHNPCALPFPISSISGGFPATITVASAAKGPVVPPENPLRSKGELGWKGSAATSAFRPAEPRKNSDTPSTTGDIHSVDSTPSKQGRAPLDFDLNVADERSFEDVGSHCSLESGLADRTTMGLDLDLNRVDETPDAVPFAMSKLEVPTLPTKPSLSGVLSNGGNASRDFDLNNGPGLDEVGTEVPARSQQMKNSAPFPSAIHGARTNNAEYGNYSSWFPPGNSYSAITVPPLLPGRGEQSYVAAAGAQRIMGPTGSAAFGPELYRGPVLSSAPAVAYPPTAPFPYPGGFPFETSFPLSSNSFSVGSAAFIDSSTVGGLCFPTMPSQPVPPGGVVSSTYPRPYVMSLPGGTSNVIPDNRKWGSQSLDLNSGPGGTDADRREEHMKMFQVAGVMKRKEPDGGWDGADRFSYKQPSWQ